MHPTPGWSGANPTATRLRLLPADPRGDHALRVLPAPALKEVKATVPAAATASQVCAALLTALTEHLIDNDEAPTAGR